MGLSESLYTFEDMIHFAINMIGGSARGKDRNLISEAVLGAYTDVAMAHEWNYFYKEHRVNVEASYSTGTVQYDHTGHVEGERALTITGGTWPSWIKRGRVSFDSNVHKVKDTTTDASVILLDDAVSPTADVAAGTTFKAYQSEYPLPSDMWGLQDIGIENSNWITYYITPTEWIQRERFYESSGQPWAWTMLKDEDVDGQWSIWIDPIPTNAEPLMMIYRRRPRQLRWKGSESSAQDAVSGTNSSGASTVTTATALPSSMVGSYIRFSNNSTSFPTSLTGQNPYNEQHKIKSISGTTVTLDGTTLGQAYSASEKITISDPIDMPGQMIECLKSAVEHRLARANDNGSNVSQTYHVYQRNLRVALEQESRFEHRSVPTSRYYYLFRHTGDLLATNNAL